MNQAGALNMPKVSKAPAKTFTPPAQSAELIVCLRELAALYRSGIPFSRAVWIISQQAEQPRLREVFTEILRNISSGWTITNAISIYPGLFPELYVRLIAVGEETGQLELMLEKIAFHAEKSREKVMRLYSALAYPSFVIALCLGFLIIGPAYVFRGILEFLQSLDTTLPLATQILILSSTIIRSPIFLIALPLICAALFFIMKKLWSFRPARKLIQTVILAIPAVGTLYRTSEVATVARTMAVIFESGIPILPGMKLTKKVVSIVELEDAIEFATNRIVLGDTVTAAFQKTRMFPPVFLQFITAGEQSGDLGPMLNWAAWMCEQNVDAALNVIIESIQPIVMLIIGVIVGFVIYATVAPMLKIAQGLM